MSEKKKTFEQSLTRLEEIVRTLEKGEVPLEESLKLFEEGTALCRSCDRVLKSAEKKVTLLAGDQEVPFEEEDQ